MEKVANLNADLPLGPDDPAPRCAELVICRTCSVVPGGTPTLNGAHVAELEARLPLGVSLRTTECMGACAEPVTMALQARGKATYFFAGLDPDADAADIVRTCEAYAGTDDGWIEDARVCGRLRFCLRGRVPPISSPE